MFKRRNITLSFISIFLCAVLFVPVSIASVDRQTQDRLSEQFLGVNRGSDIYFSEGRITRVYGKAFSRGTSALASAEAFVREYSAMFGLEAGELVIGGHWRQTAKRPYQ